MHEKAKPYKCETCEKCFSRKVYLVSHIQSVHAKVKPYKCNICDKCFQCQSNLKNHIRCVHEKAKPFNCQICARGFSLKKTLDTHIRVVHEGAKPHKCEVCEKYDNFKCIKNKATIAAWQRHNSLVNKQSTLEQVQDPLSITDEDRKNCAIAAKSLDVNNGLQSGSCNADLTQNICSSHDDMKMEPNYIPDENNTEENFSSGIAFGQLPLEIKLEPSDEI